MLEKGIGKTHLARMEILVDSIESYGELRGNIVNKYQHKLVGQSWNIKGKYGRNFGELWQNSSEFYGENGKCVSKDLMDKSKDHKSIGLFQ